MSATKPHLIKIPLMILLLFLASIPAYASTHTITSLNNIRGDCTEVLVLEVNLDIVATSNDFFGSDFFGYVFRDATGKAVGTSAVSVDLVDSPASGPGVVHLNWIPGSAPVMPLTLRTYDTPYLNTHAVSEIEAGILVDTFQFDPRDYGFFCLNTGEHPANDSPDTPQPPFSDSRFNNWDTASPIVVFPHETETGQGLVVYSPEGALLLVITAQDIAAVPECPDTNTFIASANNVSFYRLTDCSYQFNTPSLDGTKTYVLILFGLNPDSGYRSYEE